MAPVDEQVDQGVAVLADDRLELGHRLRPHERVEGVAPVVVDGRVALLREQEGEPFGPVRLVAPGAGVGLPVLSDVADKGLAGHDVVALAHVAAGDGALLDEVVEDVVELLVDDGVVDVEVVVDVPAVLGDRLGDGLVVHEAHLGGHDLTVGALRTFGGGHVEGPPCQSVV